LRKRRLRVIDRVTYFTREGIKDDGKIIGGVADELWDPQTGMERKPRVTSLERGLILMEMQPVETGEKMRVVFLDNQDARNELSDLITANGKGGDGGRSPYLNFV
jgi:hypothetical protein